jgi:asparagine synthase (glutamine-hydrolysing)
MTSGHGSLRKALDGAVRDAVSGKDIAVAFSGGLDSGVAAAIANGYAKKATLYTAGSKGSHDVKEAEPSAKELGMSWVHIPMTEEDVIEGLRAMISVTGTKDPVVLSFELPLFLVCKNCEEKDILTGQGADELFAGYSKYVGLDEEDLGRKRDGDMMKLFDITLPHERKVAEHFGKKIHYPFLDGNVVGEVDSLGLGSIAPDGNGSRKMILRDISGMIGCGGISQKEKKAAQYGSGAMALIKKICRSKGVTYAELIEMIGRGEM